MDICLFFNGKLLLFIVYDIINKSDFCVVFVFCIIIVLLLLWFYYIFLKKY